MQTTEAVSIELITVWFNVRYSDGYCVNRCKYFCKLEVTGIIFMNIQQYKACHFTVYMAGR